MKARTMVALKSQSRVAALRERIVDAPQEVCVERARYLTESMAANWDAHPLTRMSMALEHILSNISVVVRDGELIVGCRTSKLKGAPLFLENKWHWVREDMENFNDRIYQRAFITSEERRELEEDILPFWEGRTAEERLQELLPEDLQDDMDKYVFAIFMEITNGIGHFTLDYATVLREGLAGIIDRARRAARQLTPEEREGEKGLFYDAAIRALKAAIAFAHRYGDRARSMAKAEADAERAGELEEIARICYRVPEHPAATLAEAVQSIWFVHLVTQLESGGNAVSYGSLDQYLYPFYAADLDAGRITPGRARELVSLLFIKTCEMWNIMEETFVPAAECAEGKTTQHATVGGVDAEGRDATNALSFIILDAYADIRTVQPNFGVRFNADTPDDFLARVADYVQDGVAMHLFNDEIIVPMLVEAGHTLEDARTYGMVGCVEPNAQGKTFGSTYAAQFNGPKCVEFALSDGVDNIFGFKAGVETGDPASFGSFEAVWKAYDAQVTYFMQQMEKGLRLLDQVVAEMVPSPFASAMIQGPLEKGLDLTRGGAVYNLSSVQYMGLSNAADSLYAVKKAIFDEGKFSLGDLADWLAVDWMDAESKRRYFLKKVPKYGNDLDEPDAMVARVLDHFCDKLATLTSFRGGAFWPSVFTGSAAHIVMGSFTGATPDGRFAGEVLGNGITPSTGCASAGATAVMNSVAKLPLHRVWNGVNLTMRIPHKGDPTVLAALIRSYFAEGGSQVQINTVDSRTLRAAQKNPEKYRDLVVRLSGYSVLFTGLTDTTQEEIISRTTLECG